MFDTIREFAYGLGVDMGGIPNWVLAVALILALLLALRLLRFIADRFLRIGCLVIVAGVIVLVLLELFG
jgi:hypothetical protein